MKHSPASKNEARWRLQSWISPVIAFCALALAIYQGYLQTKYLKASVQPRLDISLYFNDEGAGYKFGSAGMGSAILKSFEVLVDGKPQSDWNEMCHSLGFATMPKYQFLNPYPEMVIKPTDFNKIFWVPFGPQSEELVAKSSRIQIGACYCSIFDECWRVSDNGEPPAPVDVCPKAGFTPLRFHSEQ